MASDFIERNKRKTLLAALLLFLGGRGKYVALLLVAGLVSLPFLLSGERLEKILSFPAVASALRAVGLAQPVAEPTGELAMSAPASGKDAKFWDRFLRAVNAPLPPARTTTSSMEMLKGGLASAGPVAIKEDKKTPAGKVKGVVNAEERAKGDTAPGVDMQDLLAGGSGVEGPGGSMGNALGGVYGNAGPYANRTILARPTGAGDSYSGTYNQVMRKAGEGVPVPGSPAKVNARLGRVSSFNWSKANARNARANAPAKAAGKRNIDRLVEAFATGTMAFDSNRPETQSSYAGAVFDGNPMQESVMDTGDVVVPSVPSTAFANSLVSAASAMLAGAEACSAVASGSGNKMSDIGAEMKRIQATINYKDPPGCCWWDDSERNDWNKKMDILYSKCGELNAEGLKISQACPGDPGTEYRPMKCDGYTKFKISCDPLDCLWELFVWFMLGPLVITFAVLGAATGWWNGHSWVMSIINRLTGGSGQGGPPDIPGGGAGGTGTGQNYGIEEVDDLSGGNN
jgi:hypothetical protein